MSCRSPDWSFYGKDYRPRCAARGAEPGFGQEPEDDVSRIHLANHPRTSIMWTRRSPASKTSTWMCLHGCPRSGAIRRAGPILLHQTSGSDSFRDRLDHHARRHAARPVSREPPTFDDAVRYYADHRRFFETRERQIAHPTPIQGRWKIDAIGLPAGRVEEVYVTNAERLIFSPRRASCAAARAPPVAGWPRSPLARVRRERYAHCSFANLET